MKLNHNRPRIYEYARGAVERKLHKAVEHAAAARSGRKGKHMRGIGAAILQPHEHVLVNRGLTVNVCMVDAAPTHEQDNID